MFEFFLKMAKRIAAYLLMDKAYVKLVYRVYTHEKLNLQNPVSFTQKLQYLKLYDHNPFYTTLVDKVAVKDYIAQTLGEEYVIPTIAVFNSADDIDFSVLPNQFVLKVSHDSGGIVICKDKNSFDVDSAKKNLRKALKKNYFRLSREWPYKNVKPRLIVEKYMQDSKVDSLVDYKFYCFNSEVKFLYFSRFEHTADEEISFFTLDWKLAPFQRTDHKMVSIKPEKPKNFDKMIEIAGKLSKGIPFVRVDLYEINNKIYFGEMSFYPTGGTSKFCPEEWNNRIGDWIQL